MLNCILFFTLLQLFIFILLIYKDITKYKLKLLTIITKRFFSFYQKKDVLLHGVSCGEVKSLEILVKYLEESKKSYYITAHTPSGYYLGKKFTNNIILKPYDSLISMLIFFLLIKPKYLIISESDSWPFYLFFAKIFCKEIIYINYKFKYNKPLRNIYHNLFANRIYLKFNQNKPWYLFNKYQVLGNIKFLNHQLIKKNLLPKSVIFASAHTEELDSHIKIFLQLENYVLIYVPRHLNYKDETINKLNKFNLNWCQDINDINITKNKKIINIFWKFGILNSLYNITQITVMGGTFDNTGGHNIIEPIVNRNIVLVGNSLYTIMDLLDIFKVFQIKEDNVKKILLNIDKSTINDNIDIYNKYCKNVKSNLKQLIL